MQLSNILTVLAVAMTATALPANEIRGSGSGGGGGGGGGGGVTQCNNNQQSVCCNGLIGGLLCTVTILGSGGSCSGQAYCCETNSAQGGLVNINALNCVKLL